MAKWGSRKRDDRGAAAVETALCICFVVLPIVFGTIAYAYMLSFRQTVTQAAAEGGRAVAVAPSGTTDPQRVAAAKTAISSALQSGSGGLTCDSDYVTCDAAPTTCVGTTTTATCWKVTVSYPYRDHSLLPTIPGLGFTLPQKITYSAVVEVS